MESQRWVHDLVNSIGDFIGLVSAVPRLSVNLPDSYMYAETAKEPRC